MIVSGIHVPDDSVFGGAIRIFLKIKGVLKQFGCTRVNLSRKFLQPVESLEQARAGGIRPESIRAGVPHAQIRAANCGSDSVRAGDCAAEHDRRGLLRSSEGGDKAGAPAYLRAQCGESARFPHSDLVQTVIFIIRISVPDEK